MRYMKTIVASVLVVTAIFFVMLVLAQVFTGYDFSAAYGMLGSVSAVELALSAIIKWNDKKIDKTKENNDE